MIASPSVRAMLANRILMRQRIHALDLLYLHGLFAFRRRLDTYQNTNKCLNVKTWESFKYNRITLKHLANKNCIFFEILACF